MLAINDTTNHTVILTIKNLGAFDAIIANPSTSPFTVTLAVVTGSSLAGTALWASNGLTQVGMKPCFKHFQYEATTSSPM